MTEPEVVESDRVLWSVGVHSGEEDRSPLWIQVYSSKPSWGSRVGLWRQDNARIQDWFQALVAGVVVEHIGHVHGVRSEMNWYGIRYETHILQNEMTDQ